MTAVHIKDSRFCLWERRIMNSEEYVSTRKFKVKDDGSEKCKMDYYRYITTMAYLFSSWWRMQSSFVNYAKWKS